MKLLPFYLAFSMTLSAMSQELPTVKFGSIDRIENFQTKLISPRNIDIWLPDGYTRDKKYKVVYMHDGQMLFDAANTWNKTAWEADDTFGKLMLEGKIQDCIIVGVWNVELRHADYFPQKIINQIPESTRKIIQENQLKGAPMADNYLKFLVSELKPFVDEKYSTLPEAESTFMIGSSMGGLISLYGLCEYPNIFGGVACLSTHSPIASYELIDENTDRDVASKFRTYLTNNLPSANSKKIYFDFGDQTGDAFYKPYQTKIDKIMIEKGFDDSSWKTLFFEGENHSEISWAKRLEIPVLFLLGK